MASPACRISWTRFPLIPAIVLIAMVTLVISFVSVASDLSTSKHHIAIIDKQKLNIELELKHITKQLEDREDQFSRIAIQLQEKERRIESLQHDLMTKQSDSIRIENEIELCNNKLVSIFLPYFECY